MAEISAGLVKQLRERTGLGFMECKKALTETGGDLTKAEELLRIKGSARASKAASRIAAEGVVGAYVSADAKLGALVELNCETDFVAKNDGFAAFAKSLAQIVATRNPANLEELSSIDLMGSTVEAARQGLVQLIGENVTIRRFKRMEAAGKLALYLHGAKIGVLVDYEGAEQVGTDVAMHISFYKPQFLSKNDVAADIVSRERDIQLARAEQSGKPEIAAKRVEGALAKFLGEITLLGQPFVKDDKLSVEKMLAAKKAKLHGYAFLVVGEGIDKPLQVH